MNNKLTQLPTDVPVKLIRIYTGVSGNVYQPGVYEPGTLPIKAYNTYYCVPLAIAQDPTSKPVRTMVEEERSHAKFEYEKMPQKAPAENKVVQEDFKADEVFINKSNSHPETQLKGKLSKPVTVSALDINSASEEDLVALNGVAKATARKIIEMRESYPFQNYDDINERVPLPFGKDWTGFQLDFSTKEAE